MAIATLAQLKGALHVDQSDTEDDTLLSTYLNAAESAVEEWLGAWFVDHVVTTAASIQDIRRVRTARKRLDAMRAASYVYVGTLYDGVPTTISAAAPTPHPFYRILKPLSQVIISLDTAAYAYEATDRRLSYGLADSMGVPEAGGTPAVATTQLPTSYRDKLVWSEVTWPALTAALPAWYFELPPGFVLDSVVDSTGKARTFDQVVDTFRYFLAGAAADTLTATITGHPVG